MRKKTLAREFALQALYQHDLRRGSVGFGPEEIEEFLRESTRDGQILAYARRLVFGAIEKRESIDERIAGAVHNWKLDRIAPVDRCVLRLAVFELLESPDVPPKVAIDEAIELAKKFSTEASGAFVNGILDRIYREISSGPAPGAGAGAGRGPGGGRPEG